MKSKINIKNFISIIILIAFYIVFAKMLYIIPLATISLEGTVEESSNLTSIYIIKYIFGDGSEILSFFSSNPLYDPKNLWELNLNVSSLKFIFSIYTISIMISPLWHFIPQRKYRTATALIFLIFDNSMIFTWISSLYITTMIESSVLAERYIFSAGNLNYTIIFTNAFIIITILSFFMIIDILINNRFIIEEIREKTELRFDNIIENELKFEDSQYEKIRIEINQAYRSFMFPSMYILVRKLLENLVYDCLKSFYQDNNIDKYYDIHRRKHQNLNILNNNFKSMMKDPLYLSKADQIEDKLTKILESFREKGNKNAHSLFNLPHQLFIEEKRELLNILINNLKSLEQRLKN